MGFHMANKGNNDYRILKPHALEIASSQFVMHNQQGIQSEYNKIPLRQFQYNT